MTATASALRPAFVTPRHLRLAALGLLGAVVAVVLARLAWDLPAVRDFVARYPGVAPGAAREGTPAWVGALHAGNLFLMVLVVRTGIEVRTTRRSAGRWTRRGRPWLARSRRPAPISLEQLVHVTLDLVWIAVGACYVILMATSGRWVRLVPTTWEVVPQAASVGLQYLSLHWPHENGWIAYNALQMLCYAAVVLVVSPLAAVTGLRMSALWPTAGPMVQWFPVRLARAVHFPVMLAFCAFVVVHVVLVLGTGAVGNLDHMFGARDDDSLVGVLICAGVLAVAGAGAWAVSRPAVLRPLGSLVGKVTR